MTERLQKLIAEAATATTIAFMSLSPKDRELLMAQALQLSARGSRRIAEACLRYAIRTENVASRMVSP